VVTERLSRQPLLETGRSVVEKYKSASDHSAEDATRHHGMRGPEGFLAGRKLSITT
jgi:hypothetical protein